MGGTRFDSSGKPIFTEWLDKRNCELKKVHEVKTKALVIVLLKRHFRALVFRYRKIRGK